MIAAASPAAAFFLSPIDLHSHSDRSDGALAPATVVERAAQRGVRILALTDHDTVDGLAEAHAAARRHGVELIDGAEISVSWNGRTLHVLGLRIDPCAAPLRQGLAELRAGRHQRAEAIGRRLAAIGIASSFEGAMALAADPHAIGRTHFARYLVAAGIAADANDAFKRYLCESGPGYVSHRWAELGQAISWIRQAGGIAVLAHPARYGLHAARLRTLFREFRALGGEAVEVVSPGSQGEQARLLARLACEAGLAASAGSDFHFPEERRFDLGQIPPLPPACRAVWAGWPEEELLALA
jgi:predicted metal-dependent phosphoesterase TrpH